MTSKEVRQQFIDFFKEKGHTFVPSSPVVPYDDPSLLFTNAGMNQFKDVFLATGKRDYTRAVNTQKCIRAGGKHNDLDDVGHDTYHHTFFEMLGNWSFGDYFKKEAIRWAWELLTERWGLDKSRLHVTVFEGDQSEGLQRDEEAAELWRTVTDIDHTHIHYGGKKDNFWEMADTGPCGPCSEIHIDLTPDKSGKALVNAGDPRVIEIWNLVFIQYNRDAAGKLTTLPAKHVDTGMGFERVTALLQGKTSNYDTDIFTPIFATIHQVTGAPAYCGTLEERTPQVGIDQSPDRKGGTGLDQSPDRKGGTGLDQSPDRKGGVDDPQVMVDVSYRVIADHIRCLTFALADGAMLSNEGRGYVLRRILRRAVRYGRQYLNVHEPFLHKLVPAVVDVMGDAFPQLRKKPDHVVEVIHDEEESFERTYDRGVMLFWAAAIEAIFFAHDDTRTHLHGEGYGPKVVEEELENLVPTRPENYAFVLKEKPEQLKPLLRVKLSDLTSEHVHEICHVQPVIRGKWAFMLHDTYGFPIDLTELMARERGFEVDLGEYERLMEEARERERSKTVDASISALVQMKDEVRAKVVPASTIDSQKWERSELTTEYRGWVDIEGFLENSTITAEKGDAYVLLKETCFYAEQGGQVGDSGKITTATGTFEVVNTIKRVFANSESILVLHVGHVASGRLEPGQMARAAVDRGRSSTMQNHTATHMMNWALREVLGEHVDQKGSLVDPEKTRFDFTHNKPVTAEELQSVEDKVNILIEVGLEVFTKEDVPTEETKELATLRKVFGEKYPDKVRVISIGKNYDEMINNPKNEEWMNYSVEFCGGTHLKQTGEAELFRIIEETAVAKGIRRITAVTGDRAKECDRLADELRRVLDEISQLPDEQLADRLPELVKRVNDEACSYLAKIKLRENLAALQDRIKKFMKQRARASAKDVHAMAKRLLAEADKVGECKIIVGEMPPAGPEQIREAIDFLRQQAGSAGIFLGCPAGEKVLLFASMTDDLVARGLKAGELIKEVAPIVKGGGGGKPQLAQAGGKNPAALPEALSKAHEWIVNKLKKLAEQGG